MLFWICYWIQVTFTFLILNVDFGQNVVVFGEDNNSSMHYNNGKEYNLILGDGPTQKLDDTTIIAEVKYPINFTASKNKICVILHYNGSSRYLYVKIYQFKITKK